ncbi:MAG TPA: ribonuclease HII [Virgibacillus sp.]|nr:ribonuclease HII [Virgibacillus sp.]
MKKTGERMEKKSIAVLKQLFAWGKINDEWIEELRKDERKGVQQLIKSYERKQRQAQALEKKFMEMSFFEQQNYADGCEYIAGVDEAGRGPLAGPVVAAAVILPRNFKLLGLDDSKQLNEATRNMFFDTIKKEAISYGISIIDNQKIDQVNIFEATKLAMYDALEQLKPIPNHVLIDAVNLPQLPCTTEVLTKGDQKSITIAAASVLAKVTRDHIMQKIHKEYPVYDFTSNMGYGTKHHMEMLTKHGATPYHRRSYAPVTRIADLHGVTTSASLGGS